MSVSIHHRRQASRDGPGGFNAVSLSLAREKARECRLLLTDGKDPIVNRDAARTATALSAARFKTFDQCAAAYIRAHRGSWKNAKHAAQWETSLANYASPVFGALPVSDVDTDLVVKVLRPIWDTKTDALSTGPPSANIASAKIRPVMPRNHRFKLTGDSLRAQRPKSSKKERNIDLS